MRAKEWPEQVGLMVSQALGAAERGAWFDHHDKPRMRCREKVSASEVASIALGIALELMTENSRQDQVYDFIHDLKRYFRFSDPPGSVQRAFDEAYGP